MSYLTYFSRLSLNSSRTFHSASQLMFKATPALFAEPLKKKKKIDPQVVRQREERKRKKIEKQIRRLERNARQLKPIDELQVPLTLIDEKEIRTRSQMSPTSQIIDKRVILEKAWANYKMKEKLLDVQLVDRVLMAQNKALSELKFESEELYREAIQPDLKLIPFNIMGPVSTPPIENYESPDGEYINITRKWE